MSAWSVGQGAPLLSAERGAAPPESLRAFFSRIVAGPGAAPLTSSEQALEEAVVEESKREYERNMKTVVEELRGGELALLSQDWSRRHGKKLLSL